MKISGMRNPFGGGIRVRNRTLLSWLALIVSLWSVLFCSINNLPGPASFIKYLPDGILLVMLLLCIGRKKAVIKRNVLLPLKVALAFFIFCFLVYLFRYQSVAYFLWGFRNNFRFYIAFFVFVAYLDETDVGTWFKTMDILFWVNAVLSVLQFVVLGIDGDSLGGIFGIQGGSNGFTMCFMSVVVGKSLLENFHGEEKTVMSLLKCAAAIMIATMAEMKFFFFVMIYLLIAAAIMTHFSAKKVIYLLLTLGSLMLAAALLVEWFGFEGFFSLERLWESATQQNYSSSGDINRLSAIPGLIQRLDLSLLEQTFGMGLGNCDTSAFAVCNTPFYQQYGYLHYTWFTSAMVFLETGYVGLGIYLSFFAVCFYRARKNNKDGVGNQLFNRLAVIMSLLCAVLVVYNSSLRIEAGYMVYFVLALPFMRQSSEDTEDYTQR